jgi:hypothetical protein
MAYTSKLYPRHTTQTRTAILSGSVGYNTRLDLLVLYSSIQHQVSGYLIIVLDPFSYFIRVPINHHPHLPLSVFYRPTVVIPPPRERAFSMSSVLFMHVSLKATSPGLQQMSELLIRLTQYSFIIRFTFLCALLLLLLRD